MEAPDWFKRAIAAPGDSRFVEVAGCQIHYLRWGDPKRPGLLFIPPGGAHAHWFDHVAPFFADQFHVAAIDLAGCGDSGRRDEYTQEFINSEIMAVCADSGMLAADTAPTLVGHSGGAGFAVRTAIAHDEALLGVIGIDGIRYAELEKDQAVKFLGGERQPPRPPRVYADYEEAVARFRLQPQPLVPIESTYVLDHIAAHSFQQVDGGWTSKFDTNQGATFTLGLELKDALKDLKCHAAAIYAEHTHLSDETMIDLMTTATDGKVPVFTIPGTNHYPMIDHPCAYVAGIKGVVLTWIAAR